MVITYKESLIIGIHLVFEPERYVSRCVLRWATTHAIAVPAAWQGD